MVSIGNAGQLAVDMLLASLVPGGVPRVGFLDCPHVLPIAGHDAFAGAPRKSKKKGKKKGKGGALETPSLLSVNVEVFLDASRGLTIVQMRAPVAPGRHREHAAMVAAWIKQAGFSRVVSLATLPIHARREAQLAAPEVMRAVQTSTAAAAAADGELKPPLALPLEPELRADPAIWRPRSSTVLLHDEAERHSVAQTTILRFCEVRRQPQIQLPNCHAQACIRAYAHTHVPASACSHAVCGEWLVCLDDTFRLQPGREQHSGRHRYGRGPGEIFPHPWCASSLARCMYLSLRAPRASLLI